MTLQKWLEYGWLRSHKSSKKEISDLLRIIDRDLQDAAGNISADWRFGIAYNAALKLCTILLYAGGYRPEKVMQHYRSIQTLPLILGSHHETDAKYLAQRSLGFMNVGESIHNHRIHFEIVKSNKNCCEVLS